MRPIISNKALRFIDLWPKFDNVPPSEPTYNMTEEQWLKAVRRGFLQAWNDEDNEFSSYSNISEDELKQIYVRLKERYYAHVFNRVNVPHIEQGVFRIITDYFPNLLRRIGLYDEMFGIGVAEYQKVSSRSGTNNTSGTTTAKDKGFENAINAPNTQASVTQPILDAITAQRNHDTDATAADTRAIQTAETVLSGISEAYQKRVSAIVDGLWEEFIERFSSLFTQLYVGTFDYLYYNNGSEDYAFGEDEETDGRAKGVGEGPIELSNVITSGNTIYADVGPSTLSEQEKNEILNRPVTYPDWMNPDGTIKEGK